MRVVQLLNWKFKTIKTILDDIERQGFDTIQINPVQPFKEESEFNWWSSYQPLGFEIGNSFGTKEDLRELCKEAKKRGITIIVDVVFNHMANKSSSEPLLPSEKVCKELRDNESFWKQRTMIKNGDNRYEAVRYNIGLPGLDYRNVELQKKLLYFLKELCQLGVGGFKFDSAKHIGLPIDGVNLFSQLKQYIKDNDLIAYGHFIGGDLNWRDEFTNYMDILTNYSVKVSDLNKHVGFIEDHDSYLNNNFYSTRSIKTGELNNLYELLTNKLPKTLYYVRAIRKPYFKDDWRSEYRTIENINELDHFDTSFLTDEKVREANKQDKVYVKQRIW